MNQYDRSIRALKKALSLREQTEDTIGQARCFLAMGQNYGFGALSVKSGSEAERIEVSNSIEMLVKARTFSLLAIATHIPSDALFEQASMVCLQGDKAAALNLLQEFLTHQIAVARGVYAGCSQVRGEVSVY